MYQCVMMQSTYLSRLVTLLLKGLDKGMAHEGAHITNARFRCHQYCHIYEGGSGMSHLQGAGWSIQKKGHHIPSLPAHATRCIQGHCLTFADSYVPSELWGAMLERLVSSRPEHSLISPVMRAIALVLRT